MKKFGLIGYPLAHSFSKKYYDAKIAREGISDVSYALYPLPDITGLPALINEDPELSGINVTIPHKISVMNYVDRLAPEAEAVQAVNCIRIERPSGSKPVLIGYNTDIYGFLESIRPLLQPWHRHALILGNGGAAKAVIYALSELGLTCTIVSRSPQPGQLRYDQLDEGTMSSHTVIVNTTPLGTYPAVEECPKVPFSLIGERHLLYDLVYNPAETTFLSRGKAAGATIKNGLEMLERQAERNWEIWTLT